MSQFKENRGIASACVGITIATFTFIITLIVSFIPTQTLLPIASIYMLLSLVLLILYFTTFRHALISKN
jgi:4-hydroxybenzoate polyprenyltransferase